MEARLEHLTQQVRLPGMAARLVQRLTEGGFVEALPLVLGCFEFEEQGRHQRRVDRLRRASRLPLGKTFATLKWERLPRVLQSRLRELARGTFLERATNVLAFGMPGVGKSHALAALGHALIEQGHSVYWTPAFQLVQELLAARRDLRLPQALRRYDAFDALILDDIGYIQQSPDEAEVLFTLMAERYERRSLLISSNLVFSEWERIFKSPMTTVAAIDRLVHHSTILEFRQLRTFRGQEAEEREAKARRHEGGARADSQPEGESEAPEEGPARQPPSDPSASAPAAEDAAAGPPGEEG
ncbi:MAG: ATP-binding protein [Deltaproteobacteria bacterium]|nr:ATP-binding protein [Deltaproteobacteria bacterium]